MTVESGDTSVDPPAAAKPLDGWAFGAKVGLTRIARARRMKLST